MVNSKLIELQLELSNLKGAYSALKPTSQNTFKRRDLSKRINTLHKKVAHQQKLILETNQMAFRFGGSY